MTSKYSQEEEKVLCALEEVQSLPREELNIAAVAKKHGVDAQRLRRRAHGKLSRSARAPTNRKLDAEQERALVSWIGILDSMGISARPGLIAASADQLLRAAHTDPQTAPPTVGRNWVHNFVARTPALHRVKQRTQELSRMTHDRVSIAAWFDRLSKTINKNGIQPDDIWNMDEVGFRVGVGGSQWIITLCPSREARIASSTERQSVTCIEAVSATGAYISPMVILGAAQHQESWTQNNLPGDTLLAVSDSGYSDAQLALQWIKHFVDKTAKMTRGSKRLLIFDGHGSHCTTEFISTCEQNDIIPFSLPPHSSHFLQPLDVTVFSPYKHWHKAAVDQATRTGCENFGKSEFLAALHSIRLNTFKSNTIKSGFRRTGIHPFRPEEVLKQFQNDEGMVQNLAGPPSSPAVTPSPQTPRSVRSLRLSAAFLEERAEELSPTLHRMVQQFGRGAIEQVETGHLAISALLAQTAAQKERDKRAARGRKITQVGGVIYASQARDIGQEKLEEEVRVQARRDWTQIKKASKKRKAEGWGKVHAQLRRVVKKRSQRLSVHHGWDQDNIIGSDDDVDICIHCGNCVVDHSFA